MFAFFFSPWIRTCKKPGPATLAGPHPQNLIWIGYRPLVLDLIACLVEQIADLGAEDQESGNDHNGY